jgi:hypothetical protein
VNFLERVILDEGHTVQRIMSDYGYDLVMMTFDEEGYSEPGLIYFQLKASDFLEKENYTYDIDIKHYNLWKDESLPVILVLFNATNRRAHWVHVQGYFKESDRRPKKGTKTVRIPLRNVVNRRAVAKMRAMKQPTALRLYSGEPHA